MKSIDKKVELVTTALNLALWIWVVSHMKQHGNYLGGPHLIALIAAFLALFIWYRSVRANRQPD
ncbi:MAG TPA: hypothetical protein VG734_00495 [Lacunisphaera sp.]|nr:hypothetical protein [Lacunisphaera sp.]